MSKKPNVIADIAVDGKQRLLFNTWKCTSEVIQRKREPVPLTAYLFLCCVQLSLVTPIYAESLMQKAHSLCFLCATAEPSILKRIIVVLNMQTSRSVVDAPWAQMMCKIAFLEACRLGEETSWNRHITSSTGRLFKWKISIYSAQESSTLNAILPGFLFWLRSWHDTHTHTCKHRDTKSLKQCYGITILTCVIVNGSLMPLVLGNRMEFELSLAKTSVILSVVPLSWLF